MENVELSEDVIADGSLGCRESRGVVSNVLMKVRRTGRWMKNVDFRRAVLDLLR